MIKLMWRKIDMRDGRGIPSGAIVANTDLNALTAIMQFGQARELSRHSRRVLVALDLTDRRMVENSLPDAEARFPGQVEVIQLEPGESATVSIDLELWQQIQINATGGIQ